MPKRLVNIKGINNEVYPFLYFSSITKLSTSESESLSILKKIILKPMLPKLLY